MIVSAILMAAHAVVVPPPPDRHRPLTLEERISAQVAVEQVRLRHLTPPASAPRPDRLYAIAEEKITRALQESAALEQLWGVGVTGEMLRAEAERIGRDSHMPERLHDLFVALGGDPVLFQECVARSTLVDRLIRTRYAFDPKLHVDARLQAESIRHTLELRRPLPDRDRSLGVTATILLRAGSEGDPGVRRDASPGSVVVSAGEMQGLRGRLFSRGRPRADLEETREGFVVRYPLHDGADGLRLEVAFVPKVTFDAWWLRVRSTLHVDTVTTVAAPTELSWTRDSTTATRTPACRDDVWLPSGIDGPPDARLHHTAVWTGTEMIVWGGEQGSYDTFLDSGARYDPVTDSWTPTSRINAPTPRAEHVGVWTGREMIIWGGRGPQYDARGDGARYDPATDSWRSLSGTDAPTARYAHTAVWTGTEMIVWGGTGGFGYDEALGARYDPVDDVWTPLPVDGAPRSRTLHTAIWTGSEMIVWGGYTYDSVVLGDGARYNPGTNRWTPVNMAGSPGARLRHTAVWTGDHMIVFGGSRFFGPTWDGGSYDPVRDTWTYLADFDNDRRVGHVAVWTGSRMIVAGGDRYAWPYPAFGRQYDPGKDQWSFIPSIDIGLGTTNMTAVWTGTEMILWGGGGLGTNVGARYEPTGATWTPTAESDAPWPRSGGTSVWTGNELLLWGGNPVVYGNRSWTGDRYDATVGRWTPMNTEGAPGFRSGHVAVWTGAEMVVWGGLDPGSFQPLQTGGRYDPMSDAWTSTSMVAVPSGRNLATAVWSGTEMIVWGGYTRNGLSSTGGRYDPAADAWRPVSTDSSPSLRYDAQSAWAGGRMMLWGGWLFDGTGTIYPTDGGLYDPTSNAWQPTNPDGAPTGRSGFSMVSTGDRVLLWGGGQDTSFASGAVYDPSVDRWDPIADTDAPQARGYASSVWTGHELLVWGGWYNSDPPSLYPEALATGGRYDLMTRTWRPMTTLGAPLGRAAAACAWTGDQLILWGGLAGEYVNNGGAYSACRPNRGPVASAGPDAAYECTDRSGAAVPLDGSASADPDSSPGTNDDIASYLWSEAGTTLSTEMTATVPLPLGVHEVALTVTDRSGATDTDDLTLSIRDTRPPSGGITSPSDGACIGPAGLPVVIADDFEDVCDPLVMRSYDPAPGPFADHGDHHVTVSARDGSGNATTSAVNFTIDTVPPAVTLMSPPAGGLPLPASLPLVIGFQAEDDDGASGDVVHETVALQGCIVFDGATYGNRDGLLHDETLVITRSDACRIATLCGFSELDNPELRVEATDCGGNVGSASVVIPGRFALDPLTCGGAVSPGDPTLTLRRSR